MRYWTNLTILPTHSASASAAIPGSQFIPCTLQIFLDSFGATFFWFSEKDGWNLTSWWLNQPIRKILVKLDHLPQMGVNIKNP